MSRWPRMVVPSVAVHVIQRGNHRQPIFFATGDYGAMFQETLPAATLARFRKSTEAGEVIGDNRFCAEINSMLARRIERDGHGGDRRSAKFRERSHDQDL